MVVEGDYCADLSQLEHYHCIIKNIDGLIAPVQVDQVVCVEGQV